MTTFLIIYFSFTSLVILYLLAFLAAVTIETVFGKNNFVDSFLDFQAKVLSFPIRRYKEKWKYVIIKLFHIQIPDQEEKALIEELHSIRKTLKKLNKREVELNKILSEKVLGDI